MLISESVPNARMINRRELGAPKSTADEIAGTSNWVAIVRGAIGSKNIQPTANKQHAMLRLQAIVSVWGGSQRRVGRARVSVGDTVVDAVACTRVDGPGRRGDLAVGYGLGWSQWASASSANDVARFLSFSNHWRFSFDQEPSWA